MQLLRHSVEIHKMPINSARPLVLECRVQMEYHMIGSPEYIFKLI
jgi:hypothetical protein